MVFHRLDLDRADAGGIGKRCTRHAGENHRADDVHLRETALHPADKRQREGIDAPGDAGDVHEVAGEDEERHREQRKALDASDHALRGNDVGRDAIENEVEQRGNRHRYGDGHADEHQDEKGSDQKKHGLFP